MPAETIEYDGPDDFESYKEWLFEQYPYARKCPPRTTIYVNGQPCMVIGYATAEDGEDLVKVTPAHCVSYEEQVELSFDIPFSGLRSER